MLTDGDTVEECLINVSDCFAVVVEIYEDYMKSLPQGMVVVNSDLPAVPVDAAYADEAEYMVAD